VDAAAVAVTAQNAVSAPKKVATSAQPAAVIAQNVANVLSAVTAMNVATAPSARMALTKPTKKDAHPVKNVDAADAMAQALGQALAPAMRPTSPTCPTTTKLPAKWAVQKTPCKHKPRCGLRHATNALHVKTTAILAKRQTAAKPRVVSAHRAAKTAATSVLAMTNPHKLKHLQVCLPPKHLSLPAKQVQITTVNAANAVHATVMAVTAANAEVSAPIAKKVLRKSNSGLMTSLRLSPHTGVMLRQLPAMRKHRTQTLQHRVHQRHAPACQKFSTSACHCQSSKRLHKAAVWNG